jgi:hypothetical protein
MQLCINKLEKKIWRCGFLKFAEKKRIKIGTFGRSLKNPYRMINRGLAQTEFGKAIFFTAYSLVLVLSTLRGHLSQLQRLLVQ